MFNSRDRGMARFFGGFARNRFNSAANSRGLDSQFLISMVLAIFAVVMLWWTPLLFPFRIFTTSVHEVSHAIAAIIMGGGAGDIKLFWNGGGVTQVGITNTVGAIVVYSAGYLGSVIFGGLLLLQAKRSSSRRRILYLITAALLVVTVFFIRDLQSLLLVAIVASLAGLVAYKAPNLIVMFVVYVLALLSCLNSVTDLLGLLFSTGNPFHGGFNDAVGLAAYTGIPALIWAGLWGLLGAFMMFQFVRRAIRRGPEPSANGKSSLNPFTGGTRPVTPTDPSPFDRYDDYLSKK